MSNKYLDSMFDEEPKSKPNRHSILDDLRDIEDDYDSSTSSSSTPSYFLPSAMFSDADRRRDEKESKKKKNRGDDNWLSDIREFADVKVEKHKYSLYDDWDENNKKKKKKKKKDKNNKIDFNKELEPEMALLRNLLIQQSNFTDSLQREYNDIKSVKASSRGVNKSMTDLIENITQARQLQMQLVEKQINAKKLAAELNIKQDAKNKDGDGTDSGIFGASALKAILDNRNITYGGEASIITDQDEYQMGESIDALVFDDNRSEESDLYLKYENSSVTIYVNIKDDDVDNYWFSALDADNNNVADYPLPPRTNMSVNRSTNIATDDYGNKYQIIWN